MIQIVDKTERNAADDLVHSVQGRHATILADPPWRFSNRTGKMAPEHKRLLRYPTLSIEEIKALPISNLAAPKSHLYLWVPNALLPWGLEVVSAWGFDFKSVITWYKVRKDGGPDGRGVGFYFRNVTEMLLFGVRGNNNRTLPPGRRQTNIIVSRKREHSRNPDEIYDIIERCSSGPYLELFARFKRPGWSQWGNEDVDQNAENGVAKRRGHVDEAPPSVDLRGYKSCETEELVLFQDSNRK